MKFSCGRVIFSNNFPAGSDLSSSNVFRMERLKQNGADAKLPKGRTPSYL